MATLNVARDEAERLLDERIKTGNEVLVEAGKVQDEGQYENWKLLRTRWMKLTSQVLKHVYAEDGPAEEFEQSVTQWGFVVSDWPNYLQDDWRYARQGINTLESLIERLHLDVEPTSATRKPRQPTPPDGDAVIFLVHGRDTGRREEVARFLEKAGDHEVIILDERANRGRTLIEKLEEHAGDAKYAVVLLTADDVGGAKGEEQKPRARQNVVFELGWFCGQIGRENVAVLYEQDVERPSDIDGLAYIGLDTEWRRRLVRELKASDFAVSLDRVG